MKRYIFKILIILIIVVLGLKIYFEFDNYLHEKNNTEKVKIMSSIEHKILKHNSYDIHYYVSGDANNELIVFLHPAYSDYRAFDQQIDFFSEKYRVITIDLIGHGLSKAKGSKDKIDNSTEHIDKIIEKEGYDKAHFVGVSMGSLVAQHYTLKHPEKTKTLTALGGYSINKVSKEITKAQRSAIFSMLFRAVFSMKSFQKKVSELTCYTEKGKALFYESTSHYSRKSFMVMQGFQNIIKNRKPPQQEFPIFILTAEYDIELAKRMAKEWHSEIDNSKFMMIKNAGHCANIDKPEVFNKALLEFIERVK